MRKPTVLAVVLLALFSTAWGVGGASAATYEYQLVPFYHGNFEDRGKFERWLNDLGEAGWLSIFHFRGTNPQKDQRLLMRREGGVPFEVEFDIRPNKKAFSNNVEVWVREFNRLGRRGKIAVAQFNQGGTNYGVTEAHTLDDELQTWSFKRKLAGKRHQVGPEQFRRAVERQAGDGYVPLTIGFPDQSAQANYYVVGTKETTPDREAEVELKFGEAKLSTTPKQWTKLINPNAKKGYQLAQVELSDTTGTNFILVFARVEIDKQFTKRKCVVEPILLNNLNQMVARLNARGAAGYEKIYETFAGDFNSFQFVLCKDK